MIFTETNLRAAFIIDLEPRVDDRGYFARAFCAREFSEHGLNPAVAQTNISFNTKKGTLRGMHFQYPPVTEAKLVRCISGAIYDIIVDLRPHSTTYLQHIGVELSASNGKALYVPDMFGHGFQTLCDDTAVFYQMSEFYSPGSEGGLRYNDPKLNLEWPLPVSVISAKDLAWPLLTDNSVVF